MTRFTYIFGYNGVPTERTSLLLDDIAGQYGVYILVLVQRTHCFDVNGCDALLHSAQKKTLRSYPAPLHTNHIVRDWKRACDEICHSRLIQRCFMRALRRDKEGDIDEKLIPKQILEWYEDSDAAAETSSENESDVEWS